MGTTWYNVRIPKKRCVWRIPSRTSPQSRSCAWAPLDCSHGSAQIPRRRDHAHGYRAVVLGGELGDERGRDGVVGAYEDADEEAVYHEQKRRRRGCRRARRCQRILFDCVDFGTASLVVIWVPLGPCRTVGNAFRLALRRRKRVKARKTHF